MTPGMRFQPPPAKRDSAEQAPGLKRFGRSVRLGIVVYVGVGVFVFSGIGKTFAIGAVISGVAWAVLRLAGRGLSRVPWGEIGGALALGVFASEVIDVVGRRVRRLL